VFSKINNTSKLLILSGLFIAVIERFTAIEWLDLVGMSLMMIGFILAKNDIIDQNGDYGIHIYYTILIIFLLMVFLYWF
jgi:hypothetical protein